MQKMLQVQVRFFCKPLLQLLFYFIIISAEAQTFSKIYTAGDSLRGGLHFSRSAFDVHFYKLKLWVDVNKQSISGQCEIHFKILQETDSIQIDLFNQYQVAAIIYENNWLKYNRRGNHLFVKFPQKLAENTSAKITVHYTGKPQIAKKAPWDGGFVWTKDSLGRPWVGVACEQLGASSWWPCKDHWSDEPDSVMLQINVPKGLTAVGNGRLQKITNTDEVYNQFEWFVSYPINLYDVSLYIGHYDHLHANYSSPYYRYENGDSFKYATDYYFLDYHINKAEEFFIKEKRTQTMLNAFEKYFGIYPFWKDGFALVEAPYWGMEHQSAVAYGNNFKLNNFGFDFILVHESGHEWWGNAVTASDPADMWLHESFTTYSEALFLEHLYGYDSSVKYLVMQSKLIQNHQPIQGIRGVYFHDRPDNDIYYKGSWMLHTLRSVIDNDSLWFKMIFDFQQQNSYKTISTEDFIAFAEKETGKDLKAFFDVYIYGNEIPVFQYFITEKKGKTTIKYRWLHVENKAFTMPFDIYVSGEKVRLQPTTKFKTLKLKNVKKADIEINNNRFLVNLLDGI